MVNMKVVVMAFAMIIMLAGMPASVQAQSETGLVGEWHFDGDAKDSSGNGNDGTVYGATFVEGKFGKALSFDGSDDYVDIPVTRDSLDSISVEVWFKYNGGISANYKTIVAGQSRDFSITKDSGNYNIGVQDGNYNSALGIGTNAWDGNWHYIVYTHSAGNGKIYLDGILTGSGGFTGGSGRIWIGHEDEADGYYFNGLIDEVRIYNRALSPEEIKQQYESGPSALSLTKTASPYSIRQGQTTNITLTIKNTGTTDIANIEVMDSIHRNFDIIGGDFPNPRKYDIIGKGESREIQYMIKSKESGTFNLDPVTGIYVDKDGNIQEAKSEPFSVKVIPSFEGSPEISSSSDIGTSSAVLLHGEKTDVVLGEDILLKLSAVNLITKPPMNVQVMIYPPSGMSVTGSEFVKSGAGIYTTTYTLNPGDGKDIEVHIKSNQVGDFNVKGRIVYYFGEEKDKAEDHTLNLPIKVRKEPGQTAPLDSIPKTPGFAGELTIIGILFVALLIKRRG